MNITPIITPIVGLLRSRKFITVVASLVVALLIAAAPDLESVQTELITLVTTLGLAMVGGIAWEDSAKAGRENAALPPRTIQQLTRDLLTIVLDEALPVESRMNAANALADSPEMFAVLKPNERNRVLRLVA